ncbi:EAL domain-containing protein [Gloeocapsa sp. BRSZ]
MTLRKKTLLLIAVTLISLIGVIYATSSTILLRGFSRLEAEDTRYNVRRVQEALSDEIAKLSLTTRDWAEWDETYAFVEDANRQYIATYLSNVSINRLKLNLMLYVDASKRIIFDKGYDLERKEAIYLLPNFQKHIAAKTVLEHSNIKSSISGLVMLPEGAMMIASRPILNSESRGPIRGTLIMGRYLNNLAIAKLAEKTHLSVRMYRFDDPQVPRDIQRVRSAFRDLPKESILVLPLDEQTIAGYTIIQDIYGNPALLLCVDAPRLIYQQGKASIRHLILSLAIVGLMFAVATLLLIEKLILSRLSRLSADVHSIGRSGDLAARVFPISGRDELSGLAGTINEMLEALEHSIEEQRQSEERYHRYDKVLAELAKHKMLDCSDLHVNLQEITEAAAHTLAVERVGVWLYDDELYKKLLCIDLYRKSVDEHSQGAELAAAHYPTYFEALQEERTIAACDAHSDPRTKELARLYLHTNSIVSMLDAPIWLGGQMVGVVCHEHVNSMRHWSIEEKNFAASIADLVSVTLEACERKRSQEALRKAHDDLEIRVRERTAELAQINQELQAEITERTLAEEKLLYEAFHDSLTGLPNRTLFMQRLGHALVRAKRRSNYLFAVLFLDLDRFKLVNDSLGHLVGDQLLIAFVRRLEVCLRSTDTVARLGGDEFVILLDDMKDIKDATLVAERIQRELILPFNLDGHEVFITTSIGIALSTTGYDQAEDILRDADTVMYRAKSLGKARHAVFDKDMHTRAVSLLQLENDLRRAVERQELLIYYQPIVSIHNNRIRGFEALLRWNHPTRGMISPAEFIPVAEETGLIIPIGYWVLYQACHQTRIWQEQFTAIPPLTINVNCSGKQFAQPDLTKQIDRILHETGLNGVSLNIEITESILIENANLAAKMLLQLKNLGIQLYIDDFGTGYSSLSYLHNFPIDALKIDRSFIKRMGSTNEKHELVYTITQMAHNLNMNVVAEGIETSEQLRQLQDMRCEYGQGFLFSQPLQQEAATALIQSSVCV